MLKVPAVAVRATFLDITEKQESTTSAITSTAGGKMTKKVPGVALSFVLINS